VNKGVEAILRGVGLYQPYRDWRTKQRQAREMRKWNAGERAAAPHLIKQQVLRDHAQRFGLRILVETGTYHGDMLHALKNDFAKLYSIELSKELHGKAQQRFANDPHIELIQGDSGVELGKLVPQIDGPALFWLDGHYSAGVTARADSNTPINQELDFILSSPETGHVIIIDDARNFGTDPEYPTLEQLKQTVLSKRSDVAIEVDTDSIRITPAQ